MLHLSPTPRYRHFMMLALVSFFAGAAHAAHITQVKGQQVLIVLDSDNEISEGSRYLVMVGGKRRAAISVTKVKGLKALGTVLKGKPEIDGTLEPLTGGGGKSSAQASDSKSKKKAGKQKRESNSDSIFANASYGGILGYSMDAQSVVATNLLTSKSESISMSGSGISLKGFADIGVLDSFGIVARLGYEQFGVKGTATIGGVTTSISYLTGDLLLRYRFFEGGFAPFVSLGLGFYFPLSKSSDVLDVQRISLTSVILANVGFNYALNDDMYIPLLVEYGYFPASSDVKTSIIAVRTGLGLHF